MKTNPTISFGIAPDEDNEVALTYTLDLGKEEVSNFEVISLMALVTSSHLHHMTPSHEDLLAAAKAFRDQFDEYINLAEQYEEEK